MVDRSCGDSQLADEMGVWHDVAELVQIVVFAIVCFDTQYRQALRQIDVDMARLALIHLCLLDKRILAQGLLHFSCVDGIDGVAQWIEPCTLQLCLDVVGIQEPFDDTLLNMYVYFVADVTGLVRVIKRRDSQ